MLLHRCMSDVFLITLKRAVGYSDNSRSRSVKPSMPSRSLALVISLLSSLALAEEPAHHGFGLVNFEPSIEAPDFSLMNLDGDTVSLEQLRGRHIMLNFWATWCAPCIKEMPSLQQLQEHFKDRQFQVVAISVDQDSDAAVAAFVEKLNLSFQILLDPATRVSGQYGANALPSTFILNPRGQVIAAAKGERDWYSQEAIAYLNDLLTP